MEENKKKSAKLLVSNTDKYWMKTPKEMYSIFNQSDKGYSSSKAKELLEKHGLNELKEPEKESIWEKITEQFEDKLVRILLVAAVISFIIALTEKEEGISAYIEPIVILIILIVNAAISVIQDIKADNALEALKKLQQCETRVFRDGKLEIINAKYLVPGDLVELVEGEKVPADVRLLDIKTATFQIDQSTLTGEPEPIFKDAEPINQDTVELAVTSNHAFSSTGVAAGVAIGIVVYTGMNSEIGKIQEMCDEAEDEESSLQLKLKEFGDTLANIIFVICIVVWVVNYKNFFDEIHGTWFNGCIYYFKISVALAVAAIPEGLPAVITTCLALGSARLYKQNAIIKKLHSIETLGCTSVICSDKTGTLTTNNMTITKFLMFQENTVKNSQIFEVEGESYKPFGKVINYSDDFSEILKKQNHIACINNMSRLKKENDKYSIIGTPTEGALRVLVEKLAVHDDEFKSYKSKESTYQPYNDFIYQNYEIIYTLEFDRKRKAKSILALDKKTNKLVLFIKGAVEYMINNSKNILTTNNVKPLNDELKKEFAGYISENFMKKSLRTLALCYKTDLKELESMNYRDVKVLNEYFKDNDKILNTEKDCTLVSVVGMLDPPRPEVKDAILSCHLAGIRVYMITGDEKETARSIGCSIGIIDRENSNSCCFMTSEFFQKSQQERLKILKESPKLVFARSEPAHKKMLVEELKSLNFIVAMTGDGVNDSPALRNSHIGIAMGIAGAEVTKEASHMVLADDNFATIVKAVEEGRSIYMNMKAFIRYMISSNIGEVVSIFISSIFGLPEAFTSIQLLWVNLVTDGPPATALSFNPTEKNIMKKPPRQE